MLDRVDGRADKRARRWRAVGLTDAQTDERGSDCVAKKQRARAARSLLLAMHAAAAVNLKILPPGAVVATAAAAAAVEKAAGATADCANQDNRGGK